MKNFLMAAALILSCLDLEGCTGIKLDGKDGSLIHGRTLEFGVVVDSSIAVVPRGYDFVGTTPNGKGLPYQSKYGVVGCIAFDEIALMDGLNEKGLAVGTFYFPGFAEYADVTSENQAKALSSVEFPNWLLTQFATVDEVKQALNDVVIAKTVAKAWGSEPAPFHYIVIDKSGKSITIEPIAGKLKAYDNPLGVLTNSPGFEWHMLNLRNFIHFSPENAEPLKIDGLVLAPFGQGSGMVGLPGDFTPPSRFVRAAIYCVTAIPSDNLVNQAFHILNQFDIPVGVARSTVDGVIHSDYTQVTCVRDPQDLKYYFKTYDDQTIRMVDLKKFDLNAKTVKKAKSSGFEKITDVSSSLK